MSGYVLVLTTAKDCTACRFLESSGFFGELLELEGKVVDEIMHVEAEHYNAPIKNLHRVFSMQHNYPNYKLMKISVYEKLIEDPKSNDKSLIKQVYFMNAAYNPNTNFTEIRNDYKLSIDGIKSFCADSISKDLKGPVKTVNRIAISGKANVPRR